jgi:hypothetical protein
MVTGHVDLSVGQRLLQQRVLHLDAAAARRPGEQIRERVQGEVQPGQRLPLDAGRSAHAIADRREAGVDLRAGRVAGRADAAQDDLSGLPALNDEQRPQRRQGRIGVGVTRAPGAEVADQASRSRAVDGVPGP